MSAIDTNRALAGARPFPAFSKLLSALNAWHDARVTRKALYQLTDRELDDIGLCRGDIELVSRGRL